MDVLHLGPVIAHAAADEIEKAALPDRAGATTGFVKRASRSLLEILQHYAEGRFAWIHHEVNVVRHNDVGEKQEIAGGTDHLHIV